MYLLDTNVISEIGLANSGRSDPRVLSWARAQNPGELYISVISLIEIEKGIISVERVNEDQGRALRRWFDLQLKAVFAPRTLSIDAAVAERCAHLYSAGLSSERNEMLAATALVAKMTLVTHDTREFIGTGLPLINPWQ